MFCEFCSQFVVVVLCLLMNPQSRNRLNHAQDSTRGKNTVLIGYCDYHPVTKLPKKGCCDYFSNVPNVLLVLSPRDNYQARASAASEGVV